MFPSPPNSDTHSFFNPHKNPNSTSSLLFNFPPPFLEDQDSPLNQIFSKTHDHTKLMEPQMEHTLAEMHTPRSLQGAAPRRGPGKKDRHSKICTAQGVRDRRMRLSLQVARKFFDLQDMLGHDKASKTIDWLLKQSENAIDELRHQPAAYTGEAKSESFVVSECDEDTSETSDSSKTADADALTSPKSNARKSRDKARARARRRTREKIVAKLYSSGDFFKPNPSNNDNEGMVDGIMASPYNSIQQQLADVGTIERFLEKSSSEYHCADPNTSSLMGFLGNWDVVSSDRANCFDYSDTSNVSFAGNLNSANAEFP